LVETAVNKREFTPGIQGFIFGEFLKKKFNEFKKDFTEVNNKDETQQLQELIDIMIQYRHIGNLVYYEDATTQPVVYKDKGEGNHEKDSFREKILRLLEQVITFL
jgi:hypothetical protein